MKLACALIVLLIASLCGLSRGAHAGVIAECGASQGHAFYLRGPMVPVDQAGWTEDGLSNGQFIFSINDGKPQIIFRDAVGMRDAESDGATVVLLHADPAAGLYSVLLVYGQTGTVENYAFRLASDGSSEAVWSSVRIGGMIQKGAVMHALCSPGT